MSEWGGWAAFFIGGLAVGFVICSIATTDIMNDRIKAGYFEFGANAYRVQKITNPEPHGDQSSSPGL
jgi:hypothetical protein